MAEPYILGIDSSTWCTGWCAMEAKTGKLLDYGKISPTSNDPFKRWAHVLQSLKAILDVKGAPIMAAIEQPNCFTNGNTVRELCGLYGAIVIFFMDRGIFIHDVNTAHAKSVFVGKDKASKGHAKKVDTLNKANSMFGISLSLKKSKKNNKPEDEDLGDAIQVAYTLRYDLIAAKTPGWV